MYEGTPIFWIDIFRILGSPSNVCLLLIGETTALDVNLAYSA